ncbi:hypothetical protein CP532_6273 [Ophiocordyceps camponoti-leonardi (nom. inval.)]|nr:hypothetical protein CP532_6273 [Ophiocordyceps camponoti-leonardi (nom. inval.)]
MSHEETKPSIKTESPNPPARTLRRVVKQADKARPVPCAACVGRLIDGTQRACFEQASSRAYRCYACAKVGTKCQPLPDAAVAAAVALATFINENWPLTDKHRNEVSLHLHLLAISCSLTRIDSAFVLAARRFRRATEDNEDGMMIVGVTTTVGYHACGVGGKHHSRAHSTASHHARPQVDQHMTMQHPQSRVISRKSEDDVAPPRHGDGILKHGILQVDGPRRTLRCKRIVTTPALSFVCSVRREEVKGVAVKVDRV